MQFVRNQIKKFKLLVSMSRKGRKPVKVEYEADPPVAAKQSKHEPKNWHEVYDNISQMRSDKTAPVDSFGPMNCTDKDADAMTQRFQILVSLLLSSQTKDAITHAACQKLHKFGFTPQHLAQADTVDIEQQLHPVGFYKTKAKHLKNLSQILIDDYQGDIPDSFDELVKLPGLGPKMSHIIMKLAWDETTGIGVDVHIHRISNRLGWAKSKTPEETRNQLEKWLPENLWNDVGLLLVGFGQTICTPKQPKCDECLNNKLCPAAFKESSKSSSSSVGPKSRKAAAKKS